MEISDVQPCKKLSGVLIIFFMEYCTLNYGVFKHN